MALTNPHTSPVFHDPTSKDMNKQEMLNPREKEAKVLKYLEEWAGKWFYVVNIRSGEVRPWAFN